MRRPLLALGGPVGADTDAGSDTDAGPVDTGGSADAGVAGPELGYNKASYYGT